MKKLLAICCLVTFFVGVGLAKADTILAPWATGWQYTTTDPTTSTDWVKDVWTTSASGQAPFGNDPQSSGIYDPNFRYNTYWAPDSNKSADDLWVRQVIDLSGYKLDTITWDLGVDNGFKLYINGKANLAGSGNAEGYTYRWEYSGKFAQSLLNPGFNTIAVALNDYGGMTAFDMQVSGEKVPGPCALVGLVGMAFTGLIRFRRRRS
jgi:hypothetical protein